MELALLEISMGSSIREVAKTHGIDRITLTRYKIKKETNQNIGVSYSGTRNAHMVFTDKMEADLASHIEVLCNSFYGLSHDKTLELAYEFATTNKITVPVSWTANK